MSNLSPAPGTPQTATKAVVAAVLSFLGAFFVALITAVSGRTDLDTLKTDQWVAILVGAVLTAGATYGGTYKTKNAVK
jgi:hypothetical protein